MEPYNEYRAELGKRIKRCRLSAGISLRTCGLMADVHYNQLQRIEQGKANPSLLTLYKIAKGLDVNVQDLLPGGAEPKDAEGR